MADLEELYARWRARPDASTTKPLCDALLREGRPDLIAEVGEFVRKELGKNGELLVQSARLYLQHNRLADAQAALVSAGKVAPRDVAVYRWLGEVLLRRGDAERAERVFDKAASFGATDSLTRQWIALATELRSLQDSRGAGAVSQEVLKRMGAPTPPPTPSQLSVDELAPKQRRGFMPDPDYDTEDLATSRHKHGTLGSPSSLAGFGPSTAGSILFGGATSPLAAPPVPSPLSRERVPPPAQRNPEPPPPRMPPPPRNQAEARHASSPPPPPARPVGARPSTPPPPLPQSASSRPPPVRAFQDGPPTRPVVPTPGAVSRAQAASANAVAMSVPGAYRNPRAPGPENMPDARMVLDALALGGVFDANAAQVPLQWDEPTDKPRTFGTKRLMAAVTLAAAIAIGVFFLVKHLRDKDHLVAEALLDQVTTTVEESNAPKFDEAEKTMGKVFELDSRSPRAALLWMRERAVRGLLQGGAEISFQDAMNRGKEVGLKESDYAFAHVASFLFQGDTGGAAAQLTKWDAAAQNDAYYQLFAGATLERAGDPRAIERYQAAVKLNPKLVIADTLLGRATALYSSPRMGHEAADNYSRKYPARAEALALLALAWAHDPGRAEAPKEVSLAMAREAELPLPLASLVPTLRALEAFEKHDFDVAKKSLGTAIPLCETPACAVWLGGLAIELGDEALARRATLAALAFSALYPPARALAARVALLGGRLDEGLKATEDLEGTLPEVAVVRAAVAYERADGDLLGRTLDALPAEAKDAPSLAAMTNAPFVLFGRGNLPNRLELAPSEAGWADLLTMDNALDAGDLAHARIFETKWKGEPSQPLRELRLARLARYEGRIDEAETRSQKAFASATVTSRSLTERALVLAARGKYQEASQLLVSYPNALGTQTGWMSVYLTASSGKVAEARGKATALVLPPTESPLLTRTVALLACAAIKDQRHGGELLGPMMKAGLSNPDMASAAEAFNMPKMHRR